MYEAHASYLKTSFNIDYMRMAVDAVAKAIEYDNRYGVGTNAIAARGVSGITVASAVSYLTRIPLLIVRKNESRHSSNEVEFPWIPAYDKEIRYCIIDDFILSGKTVESICSKVDEFADAHCYPAKIYLYNSGSTGRLSYPINGKDIPVLHVGNIRYKTDGSTEYVLY